MTTKPDTTSPETPASPLVLEVAGLTKRYPDFTLDDVSFSLRQRTITGFIGRNGAGKSTTLECLLNLVHPDAGTVRFFGRDLADDEEAIKRRIGFVAGGVSYYPHKRLSAITDVTRRFYPTWDEAAYRDCLERFELVEAKTPAELSEGMKVKYALTLALSHHAGLLLLDEPTSGLDPAAREDLLEELMRLVDEEGVTVLFSTHITSDLDKCADDVIYLRKGRVVEDGSLADLHSRYVLVTCPERPSPTSGVIGPRESKTGWTGLLRSSDGVSASGTVPADATVSPADLDAIMVHLEKEG